MGHSIFVPVNITVMHNSLILIAALLLMALAAVLWLFVGRRRFYRRNWSGLQVFRSYRRSIICMIFEHLLLFIATACMIFALILVLIYFLE
jgi:hypothetical protein